ncbi:MAG TPA: hypothetical protein VFF73_25950 [Planctomycetota bacterium]|nr:hypothetical protein [Planctomycetota bacterium]
MRRTLILGVLGAALFVGSPAFGDDTNPNQNKGTKNHKGQNQNGQNQCPHKHKHKHKGHKPGTTTQTPPAPK